jgi:hypothetical protein
MKSSKVTYKQAKLILAQLRKELESTSEWETEKRLSIIRQIATL